jgi:predicted short-subunit dehydrogenase-like oxidoreductase (DUF2520 family)
MQQSIKNIAFAGSGNIAWHLAKGLKQQGYHISGIWSRDYSHAVKLADFCEAKAFHDVKELRDESDLIIIAVADNAIKNVAESIGNYEGIVVHTAGSVALETIKVNFKNSGVFYPLQTFSKEIHVSLKEVPFFIEASSEDVKHILQQIASKLTTKVYKADSRQRLLLHVAAVFAGNYSNFMYAIGEEILNKSNLPLEVLHPLIMETAGKAVKGDPKLLQTGPARRNDTITIEKHMDALASLPDYAELYGLLAKLISKNY